MLKRNLDAIDKSTLSYHTLVAVFIIAFASRINGWYLEILLNAGVIASVLFIFSRIGNNSHPVLRFVRFFYPILFFTPAYLQTARINRVIFSGLLDPFFQKAEFGIFRFQPSLAFADSLPQAWFSEWMHFAYFSYYLMIPGIAVLLYFKGDKQAIKNFMLSLCILFYFCYSCYILLPVEGATSFGRNEFNGGLFTNIMKVIYADFESPGAAFPSSHVAVTLLIIIHALRDAKRFGPIFIFLGVNLIFATVYCRYHYVVDVMGGIEAVAMVAGAANLLNKHLLNCHPPHGGGGTELWDHLNVMAGSETTPPQNLHPKPSLARALTI